MTDRHSLLHAFRLAAWMSLAAWTTTPAEAQQITRRQLTQHFYKATQLHERGDDSLAIAQLQEVADMMPRFAMTYRRMGEIYDDMAQAGRSGAADGAIVMYRKYLSLELDAERTRDVRQRLHALEEQKQIAHYEDAQLAQAKAEEASGTTLPALALNETATTDAATGADELAQFVMAIRRRTPATASASGAGTAAHGGPATRQAGATGQAGDAASTSSGTSAPAASASSTTTPAGGQGAATSIAPATAPTTTTPTSGETGQPDDARPLQPAIGQTDQPASGQSNQPAIGQTDQPASGQSTQSTPDPSTPSQPATPFSWLDYYGCTLPAHATTRTEAPEAIPITPQALQGHWVSSLTESNGRERWIFGIRPFGPDYSVTLSDQAGVVCPPDDEGSFTHRIVDLMRASGVIGGSTAEIPDRLVTATASGGRLTFTLRSETKYTPSTNIYNWTNQIIAGVAPALPFGNILTTISEKVTSGLSSRDQEHVTTTDMSFDCQLVADGVMECCYTTRAKRTSAAGTKTLPSQQATFCLYRTPPTYDHFTTEGLETGTPDEEALFADVARRTEGDLSAYYALALLYQHGIGCQADPGKALECMVRATDTPLAPKAIAWMVHQYHGEAGRDSNLSFWTRRRYHRMERLWLDRLQRDAPGVWWGVKGDIMLDDPERADSALWYYRQGAALGDPYATWRSGCLMLKGGDARQAATYLAEAGRLGQPDAWVTLAIIRRDGLDGSAPDPEAYLQCLAQAARSGSADALREIADAYMQGTSLPFDYATGTSMRHRWWHASHNLWLPEVHALGFAVTPMPQPL